jgi:hypothetical protein
MSQRNFPDVIRGALPLVALGMAATGGAAILLIAGDTLGYDYQAYLRAAQRILDGKQLYDPAVDLAGGFAVYLYPPPFALAIVPFALLPEALGTWLWIAVLGVAILAGIAAMPVSRDIRWIVLFLAGMNWPVLYGLKLGQVSALLFLLFAFSWRWIDRPASVGTTAALGGLIKLQPAVVLGWAALTGRGRAAFVGLIVAAAVAVTATLVVGVGAWVDYLALLGRVSAPVTTPHNFTPGAVAFQLGATESVATTIQLVSAVAVAIASLIAIRWSTHEASLLVLAVGSQLLSPLLWDHYAIVLLLPMAYLLQHGHWWAVGIPLATSLPLIGLTPAAAYPVLFWVSLLAPAIVGRRRTGTSGPAIVPESVG